MRCHMSQSDKLKQITGRVKREMDRTIREINRYYASYSQELENRQILDPNNEEQRALAEQFFQRETENLKQELHQFIESGINEEDALKSELPRAYALVKTASKFLWNKPHYDVQLMGGILLNDGYVSQMATGEGKTLTAALPAYLNALLGKGVHVLTPNAYLAKRDQEEMGELYGLLGLSCGLANTERFDFTQADVQRRMDEIIAREVSELSYQIDCSSAGTKKGRKTDTETSQRRIKK